MSWPDTPAIVQAGGMVGRIAVFVGWCVAAPAALACDIALVLAVDVSGSVDEVEYNLQMDGLAAAMLDPAVADAMVQARARLLLMQWTGSDRQAVVIPWRPVETYRDVDTLAAEVAAQPRVWRNFSTAIGEAIGLAISALDSPEVADCKRHVIDISGDGPSNEGVSPQVARQEALRRGITINALVIEESEAGLAAYFRENVITGPAAFAVSAARFEDYPERMRQKLLREVVLQLTVREP